jgi:cytochrome c biogenesis protein CcmG/thiol:disulfide interchange protein DsbE
MARTVTNHSGADEFDGNRTVVRAAVQLASAQRRVMLRAAIGLGISMTGSLIAWPARANHLKVGEPAPPLVLHTLDGRSIATGDLVGQVVIATFWATWCDPCREELPLLSTYAAKHSPDGLQVLGFSLDGPDELPKVREVAGKLNFPVGLLGSPWAGGYGRIWHLPVSFVIDRSGRLAYDGWGDAQPVWSEKRLQQIVDPLLANR